MFPNISTLTVDIELSISRPSRVEDYVGSTPPPHESVFLWVQGGFQSGSQGFDS